jgi:hypothetical protein
MIEETRAAEIWETVRPVMNAERWLEAIKLLQNYFSWRTVDVQWSRFVIFGEPRSTIWDLWGLP